MSKEKQIEEMSNLINKNLFNYLNQDNLSCKDVCDLLANDLLKYYQPKLPEDSVVLTKSQYDMLIALSSYEGSIEQLKNTVTLPKEEYDCLKKIEKSYDPFWFCSFGGCEGVYKECKDTCEMSIFVKERKETAETILKKASGYGDAFYVNLKEILLDLDLIED